MLHNKKIQLKKATVLLFIPIFGYQTHCAAQVEEIIVSAQKRTQNAQDTPVSLAVFGSDASLAIGNDIGAFAGQVPGVEAYASGSPIQSFFIRGIGLNEFAGNFNSPVAVHRDEVYVSKNWQATQPAFDIERIEVLKGPQGTVFGRNTTGGSVNFYTKAPTPDFEAFARVEADNHERYNLQASLSGPLSETISGRLSVYSGFGTGGTQFNLFDGEEHGAPDVHQARGQLLWRHATTEIKLFAQGGIDHSDMIAYKGPGVFSGPDLSFCPEVLTGNISFSPGTCLKFGGIAAANGNPDAEREPSGAFTINQDSPGERRDHFFGGYVRISHGFNAFKLTSLTSFDHYLRDQFEDSDGSNVESVAVDYFNAIDQFTQEVRLESSLMNDRLVVLIGGFYQRDNLAQADSGSLAQNPLNLPPANRGFPPRLINLFDQEVRSFALFSNNDFKLTPDLTLSAGLRFTTEKTSVDGQTNIGLNDVIGPRDIPQTLLVPGGIDSIGPQTNALNTTQLGITSNTRVDNDVSWKIGASYTGLTDTLLYFTAQTGFRTGGFSIPLGGLIVEFEDERVFALEAGLKMQLAANRLQINAATYRTSITSAQVNVDDPVSPLVPLTRNIPKVLSWGVEADVVYVPNSEFFVRFGAAYNNSTVKDAGGASVSTIARAPIPLQGNDTVNAPRWQLNGQVQYTLPTAVTPGDHALDVSLDARWVASRFFEITNQPSDFAPAYFLANAAISLRPNPNSGGQFKVSLFARNMLNKAYTTYINNLPGIGFKLDVFGERRTIGISAALDF